MLRTMKMDARWQLQRSVTAITFDGDVVIATKETYSGFVPKEQFMQENLDWSFAYFEKMYNPNCMLAFIPNGWTLTLTHAADLSFSSSSSINSLPLASEANLTSL